MSGSLLLVGKLAGQQEDAFFLPAGASGSSLIYLLDLLSSRRFLIDSGASVSVFPAPPSASGSVVRLVTAYGSSLTCSSSRVIPLRFGSHRFDWPFQLAPVSLSILGADFLCHHHLLLDVCMFCLVSPGSPELILALSAPSSHPPISPLPSASLTSSLSFQMSSLLMGSQPLNLAIRSATIF